MNRSAMLLCLSFSTLCAADLQISDIRIEVGRGEPISSEETIRYKEGSNSQFATQTIAADDTYEEPHLALSLLYARGWLDPIGFVWAAGVEYQSSSEDYLGEAYSTDLFGALARGGIGWTPAPLWRIEATAEGHFGYIREEDYDVTLSGDLDHGTADGVYTALGLQVGAGYAINGKWDVGVSLRALWYSASMEAEFDETGGSYESDIDWLLLTVAGSVAYRF